MDLMEKYHDYILIDVRYEDEYRSGHLPKAINIPCDELVERIPYMIKDRSKGLIVYCEHGFRSSKAREKLIHLGYRNVIYYGSMHKYSGELEK